MGGLAVAERVSGPLVFRPKLGEQIVLRDLVIDGSGPIALDIEFPRVESYLWPMVTLNNVTVRGDWTVGIKLRNCWNSTLTNCYVSGLITDSTVAKPKMEIGIDCGNSMDVHVIRPRVTSAQIGVRVLDEDLGGHGEGFHAEGGWLMHCSTGVRLEGFGSGGWPTPVAHVRNMHIFHLVHGVFATKYCGVHITANDFCGSHLAAFPTGVYMADGCTESFVTENRFWRTGPKAGAGIVLDATGRTLVVGNVVSPALSVGGVITPSCQVSEFGNSWGAPLYNLQR